MVEERCCWEALASVSVCVQLEASLGLVSQECNWTWKQLPLYKCKILITRAMCLHLLYFVVSTRILKTPTIISVPCLLFPRVLCAQLFPNVATHQINSWHFKRSNYMDTNVPSYYRRALPTPSPWVGMCRQWHRIDSDPQQGDCEPVVLFLYAPNCTAAGLNLLRS